MQLLKGKEMVAIPDIIPKIIDHGGSAEDSILVTLALAVRDALISADFKKGSIMESTELGEKDGKSLHIFPGDFHYEDFEAKVGELAIATWKDQTSRFSAEIHVDRVEAYVFAIGDSADNYREIVKLADIPSELTSLQDSFGFGV